MFVRDLHKNMVRQIVYMKTFGRRKNLLLLLSFFLLVMYTCTWYAIYPSEGIKLIEDQNDDHFHLNRSLAHYIDDIKLLIEPSIAPCAKHEEIDLITLVASAPHHFEYRQAIRHTWAKYQRTYFLLGVHGNDQEQELAANQKEAEEYNDLIVFNFYDHYKNSTLKTALMMFWTHHRCPQAEFMLKTVDGVLVNPWTLRTILIKNHNAKLLGYGHTLKLVYFKKNNKWYDWAYNVDIVPQYLAGSAYLIRGEYLNKILRKASEAPLISLEDIYFTYIVAHKGLGLTLRHDWRFSPKRPMFHIACAYRMMASTHGLSPKDMVTAWKMIDSKDRSTCNSFVTYLLVNEWLLI